MRQLIFVVPLFMLLLFVVSLFSPNLARRVSHERFFDRQTLLVINQKQLARRIDDFTVSRLGSVLRGIDVAAIAEDLEMPASRVKLIADGTTEIAGAAVDPIVRSVLGRDVSVALFPFRYDVTLPLREQLLAHLVLVCRPKQVAHADELLERITGVPATEEAYYGAYAIKRYLPEGAPFIATTRVDRLVLVSANERLLRRCLDNYDRRTETLATDPDYHATKKMFPNTAFYGYLNVAGVTELFNQPIAAPSGPDANSTSGERQRLSLYQNGFFGGWIEDRTVSHKVVLTFDPSRIPVELSSLFSAPPVITESAAHLTADTLWYYWTNSYAPEAILQLLRRQQAKQVSSSIDALLTELETSTGTSVEQLAEFFDNDLLVAMKKSPKEDLLPIPLVMIAVKCKDPATIKHLVEKIVVHYTVPVRRRAVGEHTIVSWGEVAPISSFEPSIASIGEYLLIANNVSQIRDFIAIPAGTERLSDSALFELVNDGFIYANNSLVFLNFAELSGQLKELVSWGGLALAIKDRTIAGKSKIVIDRLINPLLDGLAMYGVVGTRKYLRGKQVIMEATAVIDDGN
ncbi:MAG: DUF3352 domain-containing protein [Desulfofustis sp.]|nr:DUF3352 domain-containing protein [Desulfofustis sp.]